MSRTKREKYGDISQADDAINGRKAKEARSLDAVEIPALHMAWPCGVVLGRAHPGRVGNHRLPGTSWLKSTSDRTSGAAADWREGSVPAGSEPDRRFGGAG